MGNCCSTQSVRAAPVQRVGPLTAEGLVHYVPEQDRRHLRLGLRIPGMLLFLEHIGFAEWTGLGEKNFDNDDGEGVFTDWNYPRGYTRDSGLAAWLDAEVGSVKECRWGTGCPRLGRKYNVMGYDLADYVRRWQRGKGLEQLSVCEIILTQPECQHLRQYVGIANLFWSHIQQEGFLGSGTSYHDRVSSTQGAGWSTLSHLLHVHSRNQGRLPPRDMCFFWLDYFCLRQCQRDFDVDCTIELIKDIGQLVSTIDNKFSYLKRSFCILELYGAIAGGSDLVCHQLVTGSKSGMLDILAPDRPKVTVGQRGLAHFWVGPVDVAAAQTRNPSDKDMIDDFIRRLPGGFNYMDRVVTTALLEPLIDDLPTLEEFVARLEEEESENDA